MDFAVRVEGEEQGHWVLDTDPIGERFLITSNDGIFQWIEMADCRLIKMSTPEQPTLVAVVKPNQSAPSLVVPR